MGVRRVEGDPQAISRVAASQKQEQQGGTGAAGGAGAAAARVLRASGWASPTRHPACIPPIRNGTFMVIVPVDEQSRLLFAI